MPLHPRFPPRVGLTSLARSYDFLVPAYEGGASTSIVNDAGGGAAPTTLRGQRQLGYAMYAVADEVCPLQ
jgi:hypothetical protein